VLIGTNYNFCLMYMPFSLMSDHMVCIEIFFIACKRNANFLHLV